MSTIRYSCKSIAFITTIICLLLGCTGCKLNSKNEKDAADLTGSIFRPEDIGVVSFDISKIGSTPLKSEFYICPANGMIKIRYEEGNWSDLKVDLYDIKYEESIQTGEIKRLGGDLTFSNLSGENQYYFKIDGARGSNGERLVFSLDK